MKLKEFILKAIDAHYSEAPQEKVSRAKSILEQANFEHYHQNDYIPLSQVIVQVLEALGEIKATKAFNKSFLAQTFLVCTGKNYQLSDDAIKALVEEMYDVGQPGFEERIRQAIKAERANLPPAELITSQSADINLFGLLDRYMKLRSSELNHRSYSTGEHLSIAKEIKLTFPDGLILRGDQHLEVYSLNTADGNAEAFHSGKAHSLSFAEIVACAGDFFGIPELPIAAGETKEERQRRFIEHYNRMAGVTHLSTLVSDCIWYTKWVPTSALETQRLNSRLSSEFGKNYYYKLLSANFDHFVPFAEKAYKAGHKVAMDIARQAGEIAKSDPNKAKGWLTLAYTIEAFALHFLTDNFAAGHMRVPRASLPFEFGMVKGGICVNEMHNSDGKHGLLVEDSMNRRWRIYGDGHYKTESKAAKKHLTNAVQHSVDEVFSTFTLAQTQEIKKLHTDVPKYIPRTVLPAGTTQSVTYKTENGKKHTQWNPKYKLDDSLAYHPHYGGHPELNPGYVQLNMRRVDSDVGSVRRAYFYLFSSFDDDETADIALDPNDKTRLLAREQKHFQR